MSAQERVWQALEEANLPDPAVRPYKVMPLREGPWGPACFVEVSAPGHESILSEVTDYDDVRSLAVRIETMVTSLLDDTGTR